MIGHLSGHFDDLGRGAQVAFASMFGRRVRENVLWAQAQRDAYDQGEIRRVADRFKSLDRGDEAHVEKPHLYIDM